MTTYSAAVERHMVNLYRSLSEKDRRRYAAVEAEKLGHGGVAYVADLFGCDPDTIQHGRADVEQLPRTPRLDASGKKGGRKKASCQQPELVATLREIVEVHTAGSPVEPGELWTNRSPSELSEELSAAGFSASPNTVTRLLHEELELSQRSAVKTVALGESTDRDAQFGALPS